MSHQRTMETGPGVTARTPFSQSTLPPTFPPVVDPTTYKLKEVEYLLNQSAFINVFATSISAKPADAGHGSGTYSWGTRDITIMFLNRQGETTGTLEANIV